jgi:transcriptional regulator with GAF, ATPase, and Fis domain
LAATLGGRYRYVRELGQGSTSRVVVVEDTIAGGLGAAKVVPSEHNERLRWEFSRLASLSHPNLTAVRELLRLATHAPMPFGLRAGTLVLISELAPGLPSDARALTLPTMSERVQFARRVGAACARALWAIHSAGLVHGDVKPSNIIVPEAISEAHDARLIDLGLAGATGAGPVAGTLEFLAPEAWLGERSALSDLFALGVTLHRWLMPGSIGIRHNFDDVRNPKKRAAWADQLPDEVPDSLRSLIRELVAERPIERPSSAREVLRRLSEDGVSETAEHIERSSHRAILLDQPSGEERARHVGLLPLRGRARELQFLSAALGDPGIVIVHGPSGSGRTRVIREAALALQAERARSGLEVPTWISGVLPRHLDHAAIIHDETGSFSIAHANAAVRAAELDGISLTVVLERTSTPDRGFRQIAIGPVDDAALAEILCDALTLRQAPAGLCRAAREASSGLPGRLCRLLAGAFAEGHDPSRMEVMRRLARKACTTIAIPEATIDLAEALALVGGTLQSSEVEGVTALAELARSASLLSSSGLATIDEQGLVLRPDCVRVIEAELEPMRRRALARALDRTATSKLVRACVDAALDRHEQARGSFLAIAKTKRDEGEPLAAADVLELAKRRLPTSECEDISIDLADALRAAGEEREACRLLEEGACSRRALALHVDLLRITGDLETAERLGTQLQHEEDAPALLARSTLARLSWTRGELEEAARLAKSVRTNATNHPSAMARALETEALIAFSSNEISTVRTLAVELEHLGVAIPGHEGLAIRARASSIAGTAAWASDMRESALSHYERAASLATRAGERHVAASATVNLGLALLDLGRLGPAIDSLRRGAHELMALLRPRELGRALFNLANAAFLAGNDALAEQAAQKACFEARAAGDAEAEVHAGIVLGDLEVRTGRVRSGIRIFESLDPATSVSPAIDARLAIAFTSLGEIPKAQIHIERARRATPLDSALDSEVAIAEARVALGKGELARGEVLAQRAMTVSHTFETRIRAALLAADIAELDGRRADASMRLAFCRTLLDEAAAELDQASRARLRAVSTYERALVVRPEATAPPSPNSENRRVIVLARRVVAEKTPARVIESLANAALDLTSAERAFVIARGDHGEMKLVCARGLSGALGQEHSPSRSIAARVIDERRALVTVDAMDDTRLDGAASVHSMALRSVLAVPLEAQNERPLVLYVDDRQRPAAFDERMTDDLAALAELGSAALSAAERYRDQRREARITMRRERILRRELERRGEELRALRAPMEHGPFSGIAMTSSAMQRVIALASRVASSDLSVLIMGESGTGKEMLARAIHAASPRKDNAFVAENCAAIPEGLLESTLFGHERGAFTGATQARRGLFEIAHGGSLFLDEIGELSPVLQPKLLRALEEREIRRVGSERTRRVDVRVIAATHRDLMKRTSEGQFREDLFYRLAVVTVEIPPLRDRPSDIAPLAVAFVERYANERRVRILPETLDALRAYSWPGNIRELENEIRRALLSSDEVITPDHLSPPLRDGFSIDPDRESPRANTGESWDLKARIETLERDLVIRALSVSGKNQTRAANLLGISRFGLQKMMKRLQIRIDER